MILQQWLFYSLIDISWKWPWVRSLHFTHNLLRYFMTVPQVQISLLSGRSASPGHGWTADHTDPTPPPSLHLAPADSNCQLSRHTSAPDAPRVIPRQSPSNLQPRVCFWFPFVTGFTSSATTNITSSGGGGGSNAASSRCCREYACARH